MKNARHTQLSQFMLTLAAGFSVYGHFLCGND
ncbi:hypothetical protein FHU10_4454 [Serratia fonticola]|uniref:Uncharacterized protein n=1 Tax=Serratia fonticola TaxID=47917 RepID=A0A559TB09_SERFO|nr:hypothetical protein FHU09_3249 [Serratia fonticola]TQI97306.1 hypothetical protein FHU11_2795 [Serratia fonticola]TVZ71802.1 hypothetical protein FHU10_4454 [Serratia fonticola]